MESIRLYFKYVKLSIESQLQYKASFIMMVIGHFLITFIEFLGIWALFQRFGNIQGFTFEEAALFYGIVHIAFAITEGWTRGFDIFPRLVRLGDFDRILLRPRTTVLQILGYDFQIMRIGRLCQGLVVLIWAAIRLNIKWTIGKTLLLFGSIIGGNFLFSGLIVLQATLSFWSVQSLEIVNSFTYGGVQAAQYPISIYKPWFRKILIYIIPLATVNYFPAMSILGKTELYNYPIWLGWISPLVGTMFFLLSLLVWQIGVKHYTSTGS
ncbi:ABC-2 family transporter protein [Tissierella pigra]|uniref:ABC transporter permease n=1 Tax=Tissierella pigra TaxID=2607614 RepID=A0A6N7XHS2_9FIRM|nr:ABC-2 family transporter protein [Tissierella pigra]MBU5425844.1 ABC-2 family transporter protein [Tissierella pigra]MSU01579.1 ABC transporter permease [Tissierella pigra]